jgi:Na+/melibiose symporter-like transporter
MNQQHFTGIVPALRHEVFWGALTTACVTFNTAYLIRLGGSNLLVSLLISGSALISTLTSIPVAQFLERRNNAGIWTTAALGVVRFGHIGLVILPWLPSRHPELLLLCILPLNLPAVLYICGWLATLTEVVPTEQRARVLAERNIVLGAVVTVGTLLLGQALEHILFPLNYQLLYALAVFAGMMQTFYTARVTRQGRVAPSAPATQQSISIAVAREIWQTQRPFANIVLNTLLFNMPLYMASILQPIYFIRTLGANDGWMGIWFAITSGGGLIGNLLWLRLINRHGAAWALPRAALLSAGAYILIGLVPNLNVILMVGLLAGFINAGIDLSHLDTLLRVCPAERRAWYMSVYIAVMNGALFLGPLVIAPLLEVVDAPVLMVALGVARLLGAMLFVINPVQSLPSPVVEAP